MITIKTLKNLIADLPDDSRCIAYEGEDIGLIIRHSDGTSQWIRARDTDEEDDQTEFTQRC